MPTILDSKDDPDVVEIILVPVLFDENGKIPFFSEKEHAVIEVFSADWWRPIARLTCSEETALEVAKLLAGDKPIKIDREFFVRAKRALAENHAEGVRQAKLAEQKRKKSAR